MMMMMMMIGRWPFSKLIRWTELVTSHVSFLFVCVFAKLFPPVSPLTFSSAEPTLNDFMFFLFF